MNRFVFRGRVHGRPLPLGTYRVTARAHGRRIIGVTIVVAPARPSERALAAARAANACGANRAPVAGFVPIAARGPVGSSSGPSTAARPSAQGRSGNAPASVLPRGEALGTQFAKSPAGLDATHVMLIAAAALAILLLGLAALPPAALAEPWLAALVETRRIELALLGATTLLVAVLVYLAVGS